MMPDLVQTVILGGVVAVLLLVLVLRLKDLRTRVRLLERVACGLADDDPDGEPLRTLRRRIQHEEEVARYQDLSGGFH